MTTSPYTVYLRHHHESQPAHRAGHRQIARLLARWRRHRVYDPFAATPQSR